MAGETSPTVTSPVAGREGLAASEEARYDERERQGAQAEAGVLDPRFGGGEVEQVSSSDSGTKPLAWFSHLTAKPPPNDPAMTPHPAPAFRARASSLC